MPPTCSICRRAAPVPAQWPEYAKAIGEKLAERNGRVCPSCMHRALALVKTRPSDSGSAR